MVHHQIADDEHHERAEDKPGIEAALRSRSSYLFRSNNSGLWFTYAISFSAKVTFRLNAARYRLWASSRPYPIWATMVL
jgi:hypothetical protein